MSITTEAATRPHAWAPLVVAAIVCGMGDAEAAPTYGFGAPATPQELQRFVSPLPDGRGLPAGKGTVEQGRAVYEAQCMACHGTNLEGGTGDRLVGGRGSLVNSDPKKAPVKTVESYWPYATTLFDYVRRAMPLQAPGSLDDDQVYAVSAFILARAGIIEGEAVMSEKTLPLVRMPNRDGFIPDARPEVFKPVDETPHSPDAASAAGR